MNDPDEEFELDADFFDEQDTETDICRYDTEPAPAIGAVPAVERGYFVLHKGEFAAGCSDFLTALAIMRGLGSRAEVTREDGIQLAKMTTALPDIAYTADLGAVA